MHLDFSWANFKDDKNFSCFVLPNGALMPCQPCRPWPSFSSFFSSWSHARRGLAFSGHGLRNSLDSAFGLWFTFSLEAAPINYANFQILSLTSYFMLVQFT